MTALQLLSSIRSTAGVVILSALGAACAPAPAPTPASPPPCPSEPTPKASENACEELVTQVCARRGEASFHCENAKPMTELLNAPACAAALADIEALLANLEDERGGCKTLVSRLCKDIGADSESCQLVKEKTPQFSADQCGRMLDNYDAVLGQLRVQERRNKPLTEQQALRVRNEGNPPVRGANGASAFVVVFADFQCPYCGKLKPMMDRLFKRYGDRVAFVYRHYPLPMHKHAKLAAEAAAEAHAQGKFWAMYSELYINQYALGRSDLEFYAQEAGLDMEAFRAALDEHRHAATLEADLALGKEIAVSGTPTIIMGTQRVNPTSYAKLVEAMEAMLARAGDSPVDPPRP